VKNTPINVDIIFQYVILIYNIGYMAFIPNGFSKQN